MQQPLNPTRHPIKEDRMPPSPKIRGGSVPFFLIAYRAAMSGFHAFAPGVLKSRAAKGKEDSQRLNERLGRAAMPRPEGVLVWLHGVSVGESLSALPVIAALKAERPDLRFLITSGTTTSADILGKRLPDGVIHQYAPLDTPQAVASFLGHWRPDLAVFIESDIWPNTLEALRVRSIPYTLISARITQKTFDGWQRFRASVSHLLRGYSVILAQDEVSVERLEAMGAKVTGLANLKTVGEAPPDQPELREALQRQIGSRPVILAASTHPGEEALIARAVMADRASGEVNNTLLIIAPRHPIRAPEIISELKALGLNVAQRSTGDAIDSDTQVYLADTLGELGLLMRLADLIIMAGSFSTGIGGHNPLEPARVGKAVITGPDIYNWQGVFDGLQQAGGLWRAGDEAELKALCHRLIEDPLENEKTNQSAVRFVQSQNDVLLRVTRALIPLLPDTTQVGHGA